MTIALEEYQKAAEYIASKSALKPKKAIILGTGLGQLLNEVEVEVSIPYNEIPNFPVSTVESHAGRLIIGKLNQVPVYIMQGRFHYYEGYTMHQITFPIRVFKLLGVSHLFVSNAAGGINTNFQLGDLMVINDHINLLPANPLTGKNLDDFGPRFPDMFEPYSQRLIDQAMAIGADENLSLKQGVYAVVTGPNLETKAEYKFLGIIGADAIGMSTVPETIVAVHCGMEVFAVSAITDLCYSGKLKPVNLQEIIATANVAQPKLTKLISKLIALD
ncbi:MAG: purine-nucleoside phosphorylase [Luteibaculaceae bacterium]